MMVKLNVGYSERSNTIFYRSFRVVDCIPEIGDDLPGEFGYEVINVEKITLDCSEIKPYEAYKVSYINRGFEEEKDDPFVEYLAVEFPEDEFEDEFEDENGDFINSSDFDIAEE